MHEPAEEEDGEVKESVNPKLNRAVYGNLRQILECCFFSAFG
jgi:hypothetical protein